MRALTMGDHRNSEFRRRQNGGRNPRGVAVYEASGRDLEQTGIVQRSNAEQPFRVVEKGR